MIIDVCTSNFHIRSVIPEDKDIYMPLRAETSDVAAAYGISPEYLDIRWRSVLNSNNEICMVVFKDNAFVAICNFQDFAGSHVEIGYDVVKEYRNKGIGTALARDLISIAHNCFPGKEVIISAREKNIASWRIAEKCDGVLIRREPPPEAQITQRMLAEYGNSKAFSEEELNRMREFVKQEKEGVRVYRMP